jgi:hypothetical protein
MTKEPVLLASVVRRKNYLGKHLRADLIFNLATETTVTPERLRDEADQLLYSARERGQVVAHFDLARRVWEASVELRRLRNEKVGHSGGNFSKGAA